jgi:O-antigen ligase
MRFSGSNFNPNELAMILVLALPIAWYLCLSAGRRSLALVNACYVPLGMLAVLLSGSRGGFLSALVALLIVPWSLQGLSVRARVGLLLLLVCSLLFIGTAVPQESWQRVGETASKLEQGDLSEREVLWLAALEVFAENPILGVGTANYTYATQPKGWRQTSPHQTFLSVLVGQGLIGLTLFLASYAAAFWSIGCMRGLQRKFWIVLGLTLFIGLLPRTWDYAKPAWFVVGLMTAQSAVGGRAERRRVAALVWPTPSSKPIEPALRPRVGA